MKEETILTIIMGAGGGLCAAVAFLFNIVMKQYNKQTDISRKLGELEGKQEGIKDLSREVLQTVHNATVSIPQTINVQNNPIPSSSEE